MTTHNHNTISIENPLYICVTFCYNVRIVSLGRYARYAKGKEKVLPSKMVFMVVVDIIPTCWDYPALALPQGNEER